MLSALLVLWLSWSQRKPHCRRDSKPAATHPIASFWTAAQMLEHPGQAPAAQAVMQAVETVCQAGIKKPDMGGTATTQQVTDAVAFTILQKVTALESIA